MTRPSNYLQLKVVAPFIVEELQGKRPPICP